MCPSDQDKAVPLNARFYAIVSNDQLCEAWGTSGLSLNLTDGTLLSLEGTHKVTSIGTGSALVRLYTFTPKEPLQPETNYALTYTYPTDASQGGGPRHEKRIFKTTAAPTA